MINKEEFIRHLTGAVESLELPPLTEEQLAALVIYYERVVTLNESINLTALTSPEDFAVKNVADSLTAIDDELFKQLRKKRNGHRLKYIDVGTGAGLPGVILSIMRPELTVTLLDSLQKRLKVIAGIVAEIAEEGYRLAEENKDSAAEMTAEAKKDMYHLAHISESMTCLHARAEEAGHHKEHREKYDIATARAVANLGLLSEYLLPLLAPGGLAICLKGPGYVEEIADARKKIALLGGEIVKVKELQLPTDGQDKRAVIYIRKVKGTPGKFPRTPAEIKREKKQG